MTIEQLHQVFLKYPEVCTDTRKITADCIFFALKGPNFNGNAFAKDALAQGAAFAVIDEPAYAVSDRYLSVNDVLLALQELGTYHRLQNSAKIIALTGSNGKTTTKELMYAVLSRKYKTIATKGNLNNHIGVPLTLLCIRKETEIAIVEMGANHLEEIEFLCELAQPDFGYITNFGKAHLEGFGGIEGVIQGKSELYEYLIGHGKHIFLNADDPIQLNKLREYSMKIGFSTTLKDFILVKLLSVEPFVKIEVKDTVIQTQLPGTYNFQNCAAAILIGDYFKVPIAAIKKGLEGYVPENNRSQIMEINGLSIVLDAYNANPSSMQAALEAFKNRPEQPKMVILGDMFELGPSATKEHQSIAEQVEKMNFNISLLVGENFYKTRTSSKVFKTFEDLASFVKASPIKKGTLLIKGSRGMALERVLELLQ